MQSKVIADAFTVEKVDILFVTRQLMSDLQSLDRVYPKLPGNIIELSDAFIGFLSNYAIANLGFSIHDPTQGNLVYHEFRYDVLYGGEVRRHNPNGEIIRRAVSRVNLPPSARFTPWVVWSSSMLKLSTSEQEKIVEGTGWNIPSRSSRFNARYEGGSWNKLGCVGRGNIGVDLGEYRRDR